MPSHKEQQPFQKRLVIDASIAHAAGSAGQALSPCSKHCRDFLLAIRKAKHSVVLTEEIKTEWAKHESAFAKEWRITMLQRGLAYIIRTSSSAELSEKVSNLSATQKEIKAMLKDLLLIEAALVTDKTVVALDEISRKLFAKSSDEIVELAEINWVNPDRKEENSIFWLKHGAWPEKTRQLGFLAKKLQQD